MEIWALWGPGDAVRLLVSPDRTLTVRVRTEYISGVGPLAGTKTYVAKAGEVEQNWWLVDAEDKIVGRLASDIAVVLMGKHRPTYTPHVDTGDYVVVVNAEKIKFSGNKWDKKVYTRYTGYPGLRSETAATRLERKPEMILHEAVRRMLPKNKLATQMLSKLKIFTGPTHPHQAQQPKPREMGVK